MQCNLETAPERQEFLQRAPGVHFFTNVNLRGSDFVVILHCHRFEVVMNEFQNKLSEKYDLDPDATRDFMGGIGYIAGGLVSPLVSYGDISLTSFLWCGGFMLGSVVIILSGHRQRG